MQRRQLTHAITFYNHENKRCIYLQLICINQFTDLMVLTCMHESNKREILTYGRKVEVNWWCDKREILTYGRKVEVNWWCDTFSVSLIGQLSLGKK